VANLVYHMYQTKKDNKKTKTQTVEHSQVRKCSSKGGVHYVVGKPSLSLEK